jgi:hypothetical protein
VTIDGNAPGADHGTDTDADGQGVVDSQRLYQLVRQNDVISDRTFAIDSWILEFMPTLSRSAEHPLSRVMRRSDRPSDGSASCSTNGLAKSKGKVSNLVIGSPSGQKRFIQMGVLCPAARSD